MANTVPTHTLAGQVGPSWLRVGRNLAILWAVFVHFDVILDMLLAAVRRTYTGANGVYPDGILAAGVDMGIRIGPFEDVSAYAERVSFAHDALRRKGSPLELLRQVRAYFAAWKLFVIEFLDPHGRVIRMNADGTVTRYTSAPDTVALDAGLTSKCRLILRAGEPLPVDVNEFRQIVADWTAAHVKLTAASVWDGANVWDDPQLIWDQEGLTWNTADPILVEVN